MGPPVTPLAVVHCWVITLFGLHAIASGIRLESPDKVWNRNWIKYWLVIVPVPLRFQKSNDVLYFMRSLGPEHSWELSLHSLNIPIDPGFEAVKSLAGRLVKVRKTRIVIEGNFEAPLVPLDGVNECLD